MPNYGSCGWAEVLEKLWTQTIINTVTGCYEWLGHTAGEGYGVICWQGHQVYIHRLTF